MQIDIIKAGEALKRYGERYEEYYKELKEWNKKINLTAVTEKEQVFIKHFEDSLSLLDAVEIPPGASLIDIGSGAGFPGLAIAAAREDIDVTLLDSTRKRVEFLQYVSDRIGVKTNCMWGRAEETARKSEYREIFDFATARAVASLSVLVEYAVPFLKIGGRFAAMKGPSAAEEIKEAENALNKLNSKVEDIKEFALSDGSKRSIIIVKKLSQTATIYPRPSAKMAKNPL